MPRVSVVLGGAAVLHREAEKRGVKLCTTTGYPPQAWWEMGRFWATNIGVWIDGGVDSPCHIKWPVGMVSPNHRCSILHFVFSHAKPSFRMCFCFLSLKTNFRKNRGYQCIIFITATRRTHSQRPQDRLRGLLSNGADRASRAFASLRQKAKSLDPRDEKWKWDLQQTDGLFPPGYAGTWNNRLFKNLLRNEVLRFSFKTTSALQHSKKDHASTLLVGSHGLRRFLRVVGV